MWWIRLKKAADDNKVTVEEIAARAGIPVKTVYGYLDGRTENPRGNTIEKLAKAVGVDPDYLRVGSTATKQVQVQRIPLLTLHQLSTVTSIDEITKMDPRDSVAVPVANPERCFGVKNETKANLPEIGPDDIVVFDMGLTPEPGDLVLASITAEQKAYIARYRPETHGSQTNFVLMFANELFPDIPVTDNESGVILAPAVGVYKPLR
ncbi:MAG: LexA family transcriptional regulator [Pseudomonadota bacterium]